MKTKMFILAAAALALLGDPRPLYAQGTAFTYQGRLADNGSPANGIYDLRFTLYNAVSAGNSLGSVITNAVTSVSNGLFTATLDFGTGVFDGGARWLEIGVKSNGVAGAHIPLTPRQPVTASPYAIYAAGAQTASTVTAGGVNAGSLAVGAVSSTAIADGSIQPADLSAPLLNGTFWRLDGNNISAAQFLGSANDQPLEFKVNGARALRLEPNTNGAPNVIAGSQVNQVDPGAIGSTISGGGILDYFGSVYSNRVSASFGAIGGGIGNFVQGIGSVIGGGYLNYIQTNASVSLIAGGYGNVIQGDVFASSVGGGYFNTNGSWYSAIVGGNNNSIEPSAAFSSIAGGWLNTIRSGADQSVIAGGNAGTIQNGARESFIGGGFANTIQTNAGNSFIGGGVGNVALAGATFIGGGSYNTNAGGGAVIGGGFFNRAENFDAVVGGGGFNVSSGYRSAIGGGEGNAIFNTSSYATIGGGGHNGIHTNAFSSTVGGGYGNIIDTDAFNSIIGGGYTNVIGTNAVASTIGGGTFNLIGPSTVLATIAGGTGNNNSGSYATIGGGVGNIISNSGSYATVPGGYANAAAGFSSFAAGYRAKAIHYGSFVWADPQGVDFVSTSNNQFSVRASGGVRLVTSGAGITLDGQPVLSGTVGSAQLANGSVTAAKIPVGQVVKHLNSLTDDVTLTAGANVTVTPVGNSLQIAASFTGPVSDNQLSANVALLNANQAFTGDNTFGNTTIAPPGALSFGEQTRQMLNLYNTRYGIGVQRGTVYFRTEDDGSRNDGFAWFKGGRHDDQPQNPGGGETLMTLTSDGLTVNGTLVSSSDRNLKENFTPVSSRDVLDKIAAMPITRWNFKGDAATPHVGPMAQDFHALFGLGTDDKHIATVDADGVALAAIQGLNQKVETENGALRRELGDKDAEIQALKSRVLELEELKGTVAKLQRLVSSSARP